MPPCTTLFQSFICLESIQGILFVRLVFYKRHKVIYHQGCHHYCEIAGTQRKNSSKLHLSAAHDIIKRSYVIFWRLILLMLMNPFMSRAGESLKSLDILD